jgi:predicted transcriptional regulator
MTNMSKSIYEFAYATGRQVVAPKRHWRHAIDLSKDGGYIGLEQDFGRQNRPKLPEDNSDTATRTYE